MVFGGWIAMKSRRNPWCAECHHHGAHELLYQRNYTLPANWKLAGFLSSSGSDVPANQITQPCRKSMTGHRTKLCPRKRRLLWPAGIPTVALSKPDQTKTTGKCWLIPRSSSKTAEAGGEMGSASSETAARNTFLIARAGALADPDRNNRVFGRENGFNTSPPRRIRSRRFRQTVIWKSWIPQATW